jgi:hypothetical protein
MKTLRNKTLVILTALSFLIPCSAFQSESYYKTTKAPKIQLALLLDTSNSMDGLIDQAKSQLWNIVNELARAKCGLDRPELQIALYEYGNDNLPGSEGYIRMVTPLTSDLDEISKDLFELTTNGGNEFCGTVIQTCLKQLDWSSHPDDLQIVYIAGNEPFTQGNINYVNACKLAKEKHVIVNTIFCGDFNEGIQTSWKSGADITGGQYSSIQQNRRTVYIETPYDRRISELNSRLNKTYIPYGSKGYEKQMNQEAQDANAMSYGSVNYVKRAVSKSSHVYNNSTWDLVDASEEEGFDIKSIDKSELPGEMQSMSAYEKEKYISQKKSERAAIQNEIQELNQKRNGYIASQQKDESQNEMLDQAIITSLRKQAQSKNFIIK